MQQALNDLDRFLAESRRGIDQISLQRPDPEKLAAALRALLAITDTSPGGISPHDEFGAELAACAARLDDPTPLPQASRERIARAMRALLNGGPPISRSD